MDISVPELPFSDFKWRWATLQPTEGINNPVVLLGVLDRMNRLDGSGLKYSSDRFAQELNDLQRDIDGRLSDGSGVQIKVSIASRIGSRNIIRNSGQYWKALGLIPSDSHGEVKLTDFGRMVAQRKVSQSEFAAITVRTFQLPNPFTSTETELALWEEAGLKIYPLRIILSVLAGLNDISPDQASLTTEELARVIIPLSGCKTTSIDDYVSNVLGFRDRSEDYSAWPNATPAANDSRMAREYLLFLAYHGYVKWPPIGDRSTRWKQRFYYSYELDEEIRELVSDDFSPDTTTGSVFFSSGYKQLYRLIRGTSVVSDMDRQRVQTRKPRQGQAEFRAALLSAYPRCVISNVTMPEVLEAAHIIPDAYNGPMDVSNGMPLRMDIHKLYDLDMLRISPDGDVVLSDRARMDYGASIPPRIMIPDYIDRENLRWRWENYHGL